MRLSDFTLTFYFHALEKEMATHSSVLAWRIPGTEESGGLPSMGSHRVGHDWSDLAAAAAELKSVCIFQIVFLLPHLCLGTYISKENLFFPSLTVKSYLSFKILIKIYYSIILFFMILCHISPSFLWNLVEFNWIILLCMLSYSITLSHILNFVLWNFQMQVIEIQFKIVK